MATVLDIGGILGYFDFIFPMLLVFALVFAILQKTKVIGDAMGINALIAIVASFMVLLSRDVVETINFMIPWFVIALVFFILVILVFQVMGAKEADFASAIKDRVLRNALIGISIVILIASFAHTFGQSFTEAASGDTTDASSGEVVDGESTTTSGNFEGNINAIMFNPKVLGLAAIFGIAVFAVALLTNKEE